ISEVRQQERSPKQNHNTVKQDNRWSSSDIFDSNEGCMKGETVDFTTLEPKKQFIEI
ncbi:unnamed protein product, partial [Schistosoma haematobium]